MTTKGHKKKKKKTSKLSTHPRRRHRHHHYPSENISTARQHLSSPSFMPILLPLWPPGALHCTIISCIVSHPQAYNVRLQIHTWMLSRRTGAGRGSRYQPTHAMCCCYGYGKNCCWYILPICICVTTTAAVTTFTSSSFWQQLQFFTWAIFQNELLSN